MLESLTIRQIALIEEVTIRFHRGLQVLTGETGAGKSIVVDSVNLILGRRAERDLIRTGCEKASVEAVFSVRDNADVTAFMEQEKIDFDGRSVTVYREISVTGKNICRVCGVMIPVSRLKELAGFLMDLHGQNEHQFLTEPDKHLAFLDQTGDTNHNAILCMIKTDYEQFISNHRKLAKLVRQNENRESRIHSLEKDLDELRMADIKPGEATVLFEKRKELEKADKECSNLHSIIGLLSGDEETGKVPGIGQAASILRSIASQDESLRDISERCESIYYELQEITYILSQKIQKYEFKPEKLERIDNRLALIHRLERKYSTDADELAALFRKMEEEYHLLTDLDKEIEQMSAEHKQLLGRYRNTARELTESRRKLALSFEKRMMQELGDLGMGNTRFEVLFYPNESGRPLMPTETGDDRIEFMISPNPGEPLKPLARIASGGELSRLMLAVKVLETSHSGVDAMVFDEIDTGISGRMAQIVAEKMITISRERQVICVTHLPQIAAAADFHYLVQKTITDGRSNTSVKELDREGRNSEISRMISGADGINEQSDAYACSLIQAADEKKQKL